jgi:AraC-like DNA-binding protein
MLRNRIYRGEIVHKRDSYPGEHEALVDEHVWDAVQSRLASNRVDRRTGAKAAAPSLLVGLVHDGAGERMTPTHASKKGVRYRYYVSHSLIRRGRPKDSDAGRRVPAGELERLVENRIIELLGDASAIFDAVPLAIEDSARRAAMFRTAEDLAGRWPDLDPPERRAMLQRLVWRVDLSRDAARISLRPEALRELVAPDAVVAEGPRDDAPAIILSVPIRLRRAGKENRLLVETANGARATADRSLTRLLAQAHRYRDLALRGDGRSMGDLAREAGVTPSYFTRVLRIGFLSPTLVRAILDGRHPRGLYARRLIQELPGLPKDWAGQESALGFA